MTSRLRTLTCFIFIFGAFLASVNAQSLRYMDETEDTDLSTDTCSDIAVPVNPFSIVRSKLDQLEWNSELINAAVSEYWHTGMSFMETWYRHGEKVTTLSTSCHDTAPWIITALLELPPMSTIRYGVSRLPDNKDLIVYNNVQKPRSILAAPAVQSIRDFLSTRSPSESIVLQIDLCQQLPPDAGVYNDHHFMIHAYNGQIQLYQSWQSHFTLIDWMQDEGSFQTRYPMAQTTFLDNLEIILSPVVTDEDFSKREEAVWSLIGRSATITWKTYADGKEKINDEPVRLLHDQWVIALVTYWSNQS